MQNPQYTSQQKRVKYKTPLSLMNIKNTGENARIWLMQNNKSPGLLDHHLQGSAWITQPKVITEGELFKQFIWMTSFKQQSIPILKPAGIVLYVSHHWKSDLGCYFS